MCLFAQRPLRTGHESLEVTLAYLKGKDAETGEAGMDYRAAKGLPRNVVYTASKTPRPLMFATPPTVIG